jgi:hypothetical protein
MKCLTLLLIALLFISCSDSKNQNLHHQLQDSKSEEALWADAYIQRYLEHNKDRLTKVDGYPVTYLKGMTERNQRKFAEISIGHNFENRYITDQTIYIDSLTREIYEYDVVNDSLIIWKPTSDNDQPADTIPPNGTYRFDVAFAEWEGKSMGEKVTVVINGDSIKIIYEGDGSLTNAKKGDVFDQGKIIKHKTGVWIIGKSKTDAQMDEIGGCSGGPAVIDFKGRKYWMC